MARIAKAPQPWHPAVMATMNISLPDDMKDFVDEQVRTGGFMSSSEYVRDLIRHQKDIADFRALIKAGEESGDPVVADEEWMAALMARHGLAQ
jgi:antitoxin ParD1/3/4